MRTKDDIAIRQANADITRALQALERETGRTVRGLRLHEAGAIGGEVKRAVEIELSPLPAENWIGA